MSFLSEGKWAIGQGPDAPDRQLFRLLLRGYLSKWRGEYQPKLLEVGCGSGIDIRALSAAGLLDTVDYTGFDLTRKFVLYLNERFPGLHFSERDVLTMTDENIADIVWCRHVLEHVADGELALANLHRASKDLTIISWFIRPTWQESEVDCIEAEGFLHQTYSARQMIEIVRGFGAHLYRFDIDHHSTRASVWLLSRSKRPDLAERAHAFLSSSNFLQAVIPVPPPSREGEERLRAVLEDASASILDLRAMARCVPMERLREITEHAPAVMAQATTTLSRCEAALINPDRRKVQVTESLGYLDRYDRFIFWGFRSSLDSMRHIYRHFVRVLRHLGKEVHWIEDGHHSLQVLTPGDLVLAVDVEGHALRSIKGVDYVLHNFDASHPVWENLEQGQFLRLQTYTRDAELYGISWGPARRYDAESRLLFQPWGTDLLASEFMEPAFNDTAAEAVFVGAVWDDGGLGNMYAIAEVEAALERNGVGLCYLTHISDKENVDAVRSARLAPAIAGQWQVEHDYLPCRCFKHPSYGVLAITNIPKFRELFGDGYVQGDSINELIDNALGLPVNEYKELVRAQQEVVQDYTYRESLLTIGRALEEGK